MLKKLVKALGAVSLAFTALLALPGAAQATAGLNGAYYSTSGTNPGSNAGAISYVSSHSATATFLSTMVCYPNCSGSSDDSVGLNAWLGSNATNISANSVTNLAQHVLDLTGYISIGTSGSHSFTLNSDDGSALYIDGTLVVNDDGEHGMQTANGSISLSAGLHSIRILQWENGGGTGLNAAMDGSYLSSSILSTVSGVPEPATWGMMIIGFGAIGFAMRSRRTAGALAA